jgi:hypothetical protein
MKVLLRASSEEVDKTLRALAEGPIGLNVDAFIQATAPKLSFLKVDQPEGIVRALISLNVTRTHTDVEIDEFVDDVIRSLDFKEVAPSQSKERLTKLLSSEPISTNVKALQLQQDHERLFLRSRIFTDARPVFGTDVKNAPVTILITHMLKLSYYEEGEARDFYVALDAEDIANLKDALARAEDKAASLTKTFELAQVTVCQK